MEKFIRSGDIFLDVGANIGYETLIGAYLVGDKGKVIAFEPLPNLAKQMKTSIKLNNFSSIVKLCEKAVGEKEGLIKLYKHDEDAGLTSACNTLKSHSTIVLPKTTIDKECADLFPRCIKIDVEGYELEVLQGAKQTLIRTMPYIALEFSPHLYEMHRPGKSLELLNFLENIGYEIYESKSNNLALIKNYKTFIEKVLDDETIPNIFAARRE